MRAAVPGILALPLLLLARCSLGYLTEHAADGDAGDGASQTTPNEGGAFDAGSFEAGARDGGGVDDLDAGWSVRVDGAMGFADLSAVWGSGPNDVWAVGYNMIVHWDGTAWSMSPADVGPLDGVWGSSRTDVWAVGSAGAILHFDGMLWLPSDAGTQATLNGVWGSGPADVWVVGEQVGGGPILHWDGKTWSLSAMLDAGVQSVWGSSGMVWAVGNASSISEYKDGSWSPQDVQVSAPEDLTGVWGSGPTSVWAVSVDGPFVYYDGNQTLWGPVTSPVGLNAVWGSGANDVWGAGFGGTIAHYDGSAWRMVSSPTSAQLYGVWGDNANDVWAVGTGGTILHHP